ncbi:MAG TPA: DUF5069 domain-containing protein [Nitrospiria bacterium]|nr:DUF5069 domain-containing protein [Nitrospiria bacterium]
MRARTLDLREEYPRSPKEALGGYAHLARMIDKARSKADGLLGEYIYPCPLDKTLLEFLGISGEDFQTAARGRNDQEILAWLKKSAKPHKNEEIEVWNRTLLKRRPKDEEGTKRFLEIRNRVAPDRMDVTAWVDLLDLEEGREVPIRSSGGLA